MDIRHKTDWYEIRLRGHLDNRWAPWFEGMTLERDPDGTTTLRGHVVDQAALYGLLARLRDLALPLISVAPEPTRRTPRPTTGTDTPTRSDTDWPSALGRTLHTERLVLRRATMADSDTTWRYRRLGSVNEWLTGSPSELSGYRQLFATPHRLASTVILELTSGQVIGDFMLQREDAWAQLDVADRARGAQAELGWVLDPDYTGRGYATEAIHELIRHCFQDLGVHRLLANCFLANESSWRLMERVGMRREAHAVRDSLHRTGQWLDTVTYALLAEEWADAHPTR